MRLALATASLRTSAKRDLAKTLDEIKALGFQAIELSEIPLTEENINLIKQSRIHVSGIMATIAEFQKDPELWVKHCKELRCSRLVVSRLPLSASLGGLAPLRKFISQMNQMSFFLQGRGIKLCFHHHAEEFKKVRGKLRMEYLLDECRLPIKIISDIYWLTFSGQPVIPFYDRVGSRLEGFHFRDIRFQWKNGQKRAFECPMGSGEVDWKLVCGYAYKTAYGAIELNGQDPKKEIKQCLEFFHTIKVGEEK